MKNMESLKHILTAVALVAIAAMASCQKSEGDTNPSLKQRGEADDAGDEAACGLFGEDCMTDDECCEGFACDISGICIESGAPEGESSRSTV